MAQETQERLRLASLTVLGGSLHGRRYEPEEVVGEVLIGSDPDCHLVVDLPSISPIHARVWADLDASKVYDTHAPRGVYLNVQRVEGEAPLGKNDVLWLGPPGDPASVCVQPVFEPWIERLPAHLAGSPDQEREAPEAADPAADAAPATAAPAEPPADDPFFVARPPVQPAPAAPEAVDDAWAIRELADEPPTVEGGGAGADDFFVADDAVAVAPDEAIVKDDDAVLVDAEPEHEPGSAPAPPPGKPVPAIELPPLELPPLVPSHAPPPSLIEPVAPPRPVPSASAPPAAPKVGAEPVAAVVLPSAAAGPSAPAAPKVAAAPAPTPAARPASPAETPPPAARQPRPAPSPRPPGGAARPAAARRPASRPAARRAGGSLPRWLWPVLAGVVGLAVLAGAAVLGWRTLAGRVRVDGVTPTRVHAGQRVTLTGSGFAADPAGDVVSFDERPAQVLAASAHRLEVEVPAAIDEGSERQARVVVRVGSHQSNPAAVTVVPGPRLHGLSPEAAMPGEEVVLAGAGWTVGAKVRFGGVEAQTVAVEPTRIRAIVPEIAVGAVAPVVVTAAGVDSNPAPFVVGHLPVVTAVTPAGAAPGDVVQLSGLGFSEDPAADDVRLGGAPALVVAAAPDALKVVVPWVGPGEPARTLEVRVPGSTNVGQATLQVAAPADPVEPRFVAEPFGAAPGRRLAAVTTAIGPAFLLAAADGRSAAERALDASSRLNAAVPLLQRTVGLNVEARGLDANPVLALAGRPDVLLDVSEADATAFNEDWTGVKGRGGPVTRARLARWWEAVARDLILLLVRGERPRYAEALAPEGRVLGQLFDAARRTGRAGLPRQVLAEAKPPLREGLRLAALRVPASVKAPAAAPGAPGPSPAASAAPRLLLDASYRGRETEGGQIRYLTLTLSHGGGSVTYEGGITFTVPLVSLEPHGRDQVRFSVRMRGGMRYYSGRWDGEKLSGALSRDAAGREVVGSFELRR